jgi:putative lipid kinase YegS-like protein
VSLRPGQPWGIEASGPPDFEVSGSDRNLASLLARGVADPLVRFAPARDSDLALAVGLVVGGAPTGMALPLDVLMVDAGARPGVGSVAMQAVNSIVVGVPPDRLQAWHRPAGLSVEIDGTPVEAATATTLVVMNGQYLRRQDVSPRGHPGDGVAEAQLYALPPGARRAMRARLATGAHLPHPAITIRRAHRVLVRTLRPAALEVDGAPAGQVSTLEITLRPAVYRLLV